MMKKEFPRVDMYCTGQNIKKIMKQNEMTVKDIQIYMELATPQSIYHWFKGKSLPSLDNLYALSSLFRVPVDSLLCGDRKICFSFRPPFSSRWRIYFDRYNEARMLSCII